jgi:hypothetical protein
MDRFMMSPEPFIQKCESLAAAKNTYLDAVDGRVRLAWMNDGVTGFMNGQMPLALAYLMTRSLMRFLKREVRLMQMPVIQ